MWFQAMSYLRIILNKSKIIPVGMIDNVEELVVEPDCGIGSFPTMYQGLQDRAPHKVA